MREYRRVVAGEPVTINVVEGEDDLEGFRNFIRNHLSFLAVDSETTGLDIYSDTFRLRMVQFGTPTEAWVVPVELGQRFADYARCALKYVNGLVVHNASFDLQVFDRHLEVPMEDMWPKVTDTRILSHLTDPRDVKEGGVGQGLEALTRHYIDAEIADGVKGLMKALASQEKVKPQSAIWEKVDWRNPDYQVYSGMDTILTARLLQKLCPLVPEELVRFEHKVAEVCCLMERQGFLLDVEYAEKLSADLLTERGRHGAIALGYGCENVNSTDQVADVLESQGVMITGRTATGRRKVDGALLEKLVADGNEFAKSVIECKRAGKWEKTWVRNFLEQRDSDDRCHASINPLRARTARMSITGIPAQTLPASDSTIRGCFIADPGHLIASVDYEAQELRVLAALSNDRRMVEAFKNGDDLHQITAAASGVDRKIGKMANFLTVYGGGAGTLAKQACVDFFLAKRVIDGFGKAYPGVASLSQRLADQAKSNGFITTPVGRRLPVDESRLYSALNYMVQSTSRDVTCRALVRLHQAGFTPYLRLPIHDEVLVSIPVGKASWGAGEIGRLMTETMGPVTISTDPKVGGTSWGSLYA